MSWPMRIFWSFVAVCVIIAVARMLPPVDASSENYSYDGYYDTAFTEEDDADDGAEDWADEQHASDTSKDMSIEKSPGVDVDEPEGVNVDIEGLIGGDGIGEP